MIEDKVLELAIAIHAEVCGCDDKHCSIPQEIYDWLANGDLDGTETIEELVGMWHEYDAG